MSRTMFLAPCNPAPAKGRRVDDAVDLAAREDKLRRELLDGPVERDVLAQPGDRDLHGLELPRHPQVVVPEEPQVGQPVA